MSVKRPRSEPSAPVASTSKVLRTSEAVTSAPAALAPIFAQKLRFSWFDPVSASPERPATCLFGRSGSAKLGKSKIAAFDLDGTLIKTSSGKKTADSATDWIWFDRAVTKKVVQAYNDGFAIVIISNQNLQGAKIEPWKKKIAEGVCPALNIPFHIIAATQKDWHRKPMPGMWEVIEAKNDCVIDYTTSFYVGDAAGRDRDWNDSDRKFALNCGLRFFTPEEYFLNEPIRPYRLHGLDVRSLMNQSRPLIQPSNTPIVPRKPKPGSPPLEPEVVVFVGYPGSGKTTFYKKYFQNRDYVHVNQDTLKDRAKCLALVEASLRDRLSVVVDNTNRNPEVRSHYIALAQKYAVKIRAFFWHDGIALAWHNNVYRAFAQPLPPGQKRRDLVPAIGLMSFRRSFEAPTPEEGFDEVRRVSFLFETEDLEEDRLYNMWLQIGGKDNKAIEDLEHLK